MNREPKGATCHYESCQSNTVVAVSQMVNDHINYWMECATCSARGPKSHKSLDAFDNWSSLVEPMSSLTVNGYDNQGNRI